MAKIPFRQGSARSTPTRRTALETLEPRQLLTTYTGESLSDHFDLPAVIHQLATPEGSVGFGTAATGLGDITGDGKDDFAISDSGRVYVYSGATASIVRVLTDDVALFGAALANVSDINGDGTPDLAVGSPRYPEGAVRIYSGADGSLLRSIFGTSENSGFGSVVVAAGLVDDDSVPDLVVGAPNDGPNSQGRAYVISGATGEIIHTFTGEARADRFGAAIAVARVEGGTPEYLIGAPGNDAAGHDAGRAYLYGGNNASLALTFDGQGAGYALGASVLAFASGEVRYLVGSPGFQLNIDDALVETGAVFRYRLDGTVLPAIYGHHDRRFGMRLASIGDLNADGAAEFAVGAELSGSRTPVTRYWSAGGGLINPPDGEAEGATLAISAGDVDGDGQNDVIVLRSSGPSDTSAYASVRSSFNFIPVQFITDTNDSLSFVYYWTPYTAGDSTGRNAYAFINGIYTPLADIPGLGARDRILGVNNSHVIVGAEVIPLENGTFSYGTPFILANGVRTLLPDAVTSIVGEGVDDTTSLDYSAFALGEVGNDGSIIFNTPSKAWVFKDGVLRLLWQGTAADVNSRGVVLGNLDASFGASGGAVLWMPGGSSGQIVTLTGMPYATVLNDSNAVYGITGSFGTWRALKWSNGTITEIGAFNGAEISAGVTGADNAGNVLVQGTVYAGRTTNTVYRVYSPRDGFRIFGERISGGTGTAVPMSMTSRGVIVGHNGFYVPNRTIDRWKLAEGAPVASVATSAGAVVYGMNEDGEVISLRQVNGDWVGSVVQLPEGDGEITEILAYTDPRDGLAHSFVFRGGSVFWDGVLFASAEGWTSIVSNAAIYTVDHRIVIVGTDDVGDLVIYFQSGLQSSTSALNWMYDNLTEDVVEGGQAFAPVAGGLTAFATSWNGQNIAYLDEAGDVQTIWWAPGMTLWHQDNLSKLVHAPALAGRLTSMVSPWNGLNVIATDSEGRPVTIWWAPGEPWQYSVFVESADAPRLEQGSISAFTTPWSALSIIGRDPTSGSIAAYWWAPGFSSWRSEVLSIPLRPDGVRTSGELSAGMQGSNQAIFGREAQTGRLVALFWVPGSGRDWEFADLSEIAN